MRFQLDPGAYPPTRAHQSDAGIDIRSRETKTVPARRSAVFHTGVHVELPPGTCGVLVSKSGLNVRHDITSTGLIDEGYDGEILVKLNNDGYEDYTVRAGDRITQIVIIPIWHDPIIEIVDEISAGERGSNGFGSSGR